MTEHEPNTPLTIYEMIAAHARRTPDAVAILAAQRAPLSYARLCEVLQETVGALNAMGVGRGDRVAIVSPNGPEMAAAFLAVSSGAVCAPLNPRYRRNDFEFFLTDLHATVLIVDERVDTAAIPVAEALGIPVIRLAPVPQQAAGLFTLPATDGCLATQNGLSQPDDVALVLHTSGTTSRPKIVPLTQRNLCASARNICRTLALTETDRCLNVMPLFHIHGLIGALLSSMAAGGSVVCTPGFQAARFFAWIDEFSPTWYTAVPTMHQAILARVDANRDVIRRRPLRFIRSSSAALPPQVMAGLESAFQAPVLESYGMTEASHQMASNPLPPAKRKPSSVGLPSGPEVAVMSETGDMLPRGATGEIVIRGENVTSGYENNLSANQSAFRNGWFRTGDQGYFDDEGYLFITGRLKEIINRGGEKISPREVDEVLLDHPDIVQAVTFAVPHAQLGEDVGAAVVLREGASLSEAEVRGFAAGRLADFKVPHVVRIVSEIPRGPTGKTQRIGLAERLGIGPIDQTQVQMKARLVPPRTPLENELAELWCDVLGVTRVGVHDDFFALGGDSVMATEMIARVSRTMAVDLPLISFVQSPTISTLAAGTEAAKKTARESGVWRPGLLTIQPHGDKLPLFCAPGHNGSLVGYSNLARYLDADRPLFGFPLPELEDRQGADRVEDLAAHYTKLMRARQPKGPYHLVGLCFGGTVAYEMACQLQRQGQQVALLALLDSFNHHWTRKLPIHALLREKFLHFGRRSRYLMSNLARRAPRDQVSFLRERVQLFQRTAKERLGSLAYGVFLRWGRPVPHVLRQPRYANRYAQGRYVPGGYAGSAVLFRSSDPIAGIYPAPKMGWEGLIVGEVEVHDVPSHHLGLLGEPTVRIVADRLRETLRRYGHQSP